MRTSKLARVTGEFLDACDSIVLACEHPHAATRFKPSISSIRCGGLDLRWCWTDAVGRSIACTVRTWELGARMFDSGFHTTKESEILDKIGSDTVDEEAALEPAMTDI